MAPAIEDSVFGDRQPAAEKMWTEQVIGQPLESETWNLLIIMGNYGYWEGGCESTAIQRHVCQFTDRLSSTLNIQVAAQSFTTLLESNQCLQRHFN